MSEIRNNMEEIFDRIFWGDIGSETAINEILSLLPDISTIEHVGKCDICGGKGEHPLLGPDYNKCELTSKCTDCDGTGETTRPATLEDIVKVIMSMFKQGHYSEINIEFNNPDSGILRIKNNIEFEKGRVESIQGFDKCLSDDEVGKLYKEGIKEDNK